MPFNMFPYTDLNNVNLDWLLNQMRKAAGDSKEALDAVKILENVLKISSVKNILREILDEMLADGTLGAELLEALTDLRAFNSEDHAWSVLRVFDRLLMDKRFYVHASKWPNGIQMQTAANLTGALEGQTMVFPLDMPMNRDYASAAVEFDSLDIEAHNVSISNEGTQLSFKPVSYNSSLTAGNYYDPAVYMAVSGRRKAVPEHPTNTRAAADQAQIINCVDSFWQQRNATDGWAYGSNFVTNSANTTVRNSGGFRMMECDTLVALTMMGMSWTDTPYSTAATSYNFSDLILNPNSYSWALPWGFDTVLNRKCTWTGGICWYLWDAGAVFSSRSDVEDGDIVIFRKPEQYRYFDNISHIGICRIENGVLNVYHFTGSGLVPNGEFMRYEPLDDIMARESYEAENVYFART